jgi:hypothetical protein
MNDMTVEQETHMKSFNIDRENNITAFVTVPEAQAASGEAFGSEADIVQ